jgi:hypothetical protein
MSERHASTTVVGVGRTEPDGQRGAGPVDHKMALTARFAAIRRIWADLFIDGRGGSAPVWRVPTHCRCSLGSSR